MPIQTTVAIIPARGGSKGIPNKNIINFAGKPLLAWSILQARAAPTIDSVFVSSDSSAILEVAARYGANPIRRPSKLSTDTSSSEVALVHALDTLAMEYGEEPETVVFLQATSPLREPADIEGALAVFRSERADSLFSNTVIDDLCVWHEEDGVLKGKTFDPFNRVRRQDRRPVYLENGSIYVFTPTVLRKTGNRLGGRITGYVMDYWKSFEIDTLEGLELCEYYFGKRLLPYWEARESNSAIGIGAVKPCLIVYDFDGVMTDNRVLTLEDGTEAVFANRADGWGIGQLHQAGFRQIILSTETNSVVAARARKLGIQALRGSGNKLADLAAFCKDNGISLEHVLYVGNDFNDLEAMRAVGLPVAPRDAHPAIIALAKHVTHARGGEGVIKELSEWLLTAGGG
ncbi:MAG: acylneuraminate cytidylyltransferase [Betaproteobacteria bacterium]|nr:acylneuraminate cytidylyltransferase [Betaproteobacteria bacterium]